MKFVFILENVFVQWLFTNLLCIFEYLRIDLNLKDTRIYFKLFTFIVFFPKYVLAYLKIDKRDLFFCIQPVGLIKFKKLSA